MSFVLIVRMLSWQFGQNFCDELLKKCSHNSSYISEPYINKSFASSAKWHCSVYTLQNQYVPNFALEIFSTLCNVLYINICRLWLSCIFNDDKEIHILRSNSEFASCHICLCQNIDACNHGEMHMFVWH